MEAFENIKLKFNCPKKIEELTACGSAWNCSSCQKMVYDFRGMTETEIRDVFRQHNKPVCGVYDAECMPVSSKKSNWQKWLSAAMIMLGMSVVNEMKALAQQPGIVEKVKVDTTLKNVPAIKYKLGEAVAIVSSPSFPGGFDQLHRYLYKKINYKGAFKGSVLVTFNIETDGSLTNIEMLSATEKELGEKITHALKESPKWVPVIRGGKAIHSDYTFGIDFPMVTP